MASQQVVVMTHPTHLVEESKFTLEIKNFRNLPREIVSAKIQLLNIDAEW